MLKASLLLNCIDFLLFTGQAQCPAGTNQAQLNWEYLDFFPSAGHSSYTNLASLKPRGLFLAPRVSS
jgi:hypothetical protein